MKKRLNKELLDNLFAIIYRNVKLYIILNDLPVSDYAVKCATLQSVNWINGISSMVDDDKLAADVANSLVKKGINIAIEWYINYLSSISDKKIRKK